MVQLRYKGQEQPSGTPKGFALQSLRRNPSSFTWVGDSQAGRVLLLVTSLISVALICPSASCLTVKDYQTELDRTANNCPIGSQPSKDEVQPPQHYTGRTRCHQYILKYNTADITCLKHNIPSPKTESPLNTPPEVPEQG